MRTLNNKGFSLVEIMVGLAIGMIAMIVIMQVFTVFEGQKRTTTGGGDAQTNGAIALYMIERDAKMAGWGMGTAAYSTCNTTFAYCDGNDACGGGAGALSVSFASIRITDGGTNPDALTVQFFSDPNLNSFQYPATTTITKTMPQSSSELNVGTVAGCTEGGMVLVSDSGNCTLMQITTIQDTALKIQHNPGGSGIFNPPAAFQNANGWPAYSSGATMSCFAAAPNNPIFSRAYSIDTTARHLRKSDNTVTPALTNEIMAPDIFDLQAQYGIAPIGIAPANQVVNQWENATGATWASPTSVDQNRVKAVRIAIVARSSQYEKPDPGTTCATTSAPVTAPTMAGAVVTGWSAWARFDTTNYPSDWQCYRYKIFETVVPLRNVLWGNL